MLITARSARLLPILAALLAVAGCDDAPNQTRPPDLSTPVDMAFNTMRPDLAACGNEGPAGPANQDPVYRLAQGIGADLGNDTMPAFVITGSQGGGFRLVWTGEANKTRFSGWVFVPGRVTGFVPGCNGAACPLGTYDCLLDPRAEQGGQRVDFSAIATGKIAGIDFYADTMPVAFSLKIDGVARPDRVFFPATDNGGATAVAGAIPFGLTLE